MSLEHDLWQWLPPRADRTRMTDSATAANELCVDVTAVNAALHRMEQAGTAIRDRQTGRRAMHWHRGLPC